MKLTPLTADQLAEYERRATMAERERCAKIAIDMRVDMRDTTEAGDVFWNQACEQIADAIRSNT